LPSTGPDRGPRSRDELLDRVYGRARQLWWRRRVVPVAAAALVLVAGVVTPAVLAGGDSRQRVVAVTRPTEPASTSTSAEPAVTTPTIAIPPPTSAAPTTSVVRTTTTRLVCRNSYDPRCGLFRWDPAPGPNAPSTGEITYTPTHPRVGDLVTFHITFTNPDGPADGCETTTDYGDGMVSNSSCSVLAPPGGCKTPYGPWTPPAKKADTVSFDSPAYPYKAAGTYTVAVKGDAGLDPCDQPTNPYRDSKTATSTVTISP